MVSFLARLLVFVLVFLFFEQFRNIGNVLIVHVPNFSILWRVIVHKFAIGVRYCGELCC